MGMGLGTMKQLLQTAMFAATASICGTLAGASAIDFTDAEAYGDTIIQTGPTTLTGTVTGVGWTGVTAPGAINVSENGPGPQGPFVTGDNDGLGIGDDEISFDPSESFTLTFETQVGIVGLYFLDHFEEEEVHVSVDEGDVALVFSPGAALGTSGYTAFEDLALFGSKFVFTVGEPNEAGATADYSLAAIDLAPIPLPAGLLLLGGALGMLGVARRRS